MPSVPSSVHVGRDERARAIPVPGSVLGTEVRRLEDPELLVGGGTFVSNLEVDGLAQLAFVRSPVAHGTISAIDTAAAAALPGVVAVLTAADLGLGSIEPFAVINPNCPRPPLAEDRVRFVGEPVVAVVAETHAVALDAVDLVEIEYDPLPSVTDPEAALAPDAPLQFEELGSNLAIGLRDAAEDVLADADTVVRGRFLNQRVAVAPMEGNAIVAIPADGDRSLTVHVSTQMPHRFAETVCNTFGLEPQEVRVIAPHVGGGFGGKAGAVAEHVVTIAAARRLTRPVAWIETRSENLVAMPHARAQIQWAELGVKADGTITGMRCRVLGDAGAYAGFGGAFPLGPGYLMAQGVYEIPALAYDGAGVLTNTTPLGGVRGAGRPEATALIERLIDLAAHQLDIDPIDFRLRNLIPKDAFPYTTRTGAVYDSGDYERSVREAARIAEYDQLRSEQATRRMSGSTRQLGIGVATYVELTGAWPNEWSSVRVNDDGTVTVRAGTSAHGQGHRTAYAMLVADRLGVPIDAVDLVQSDTALIPRGHGTGGSRSLQIGGSSVDGAAHAVLERARELAADRLEADANDIVVHDDGRLGVVGVPSRALAWNELASAADEDGRPLEEQFVFETTGNTYPFGTHIAVVEVDTETGDVELRRFVSVDDCGRVINPLTVRGQQHGGIAHGIAQALYEQIVYDADGNPLTTNLADYAVPGAAEFPYFDTADTETPTPLNPLGAKGVGESGTTGATPAVQNAVIDAVSHLGVRHIDLPCTPERVWHAIERARVHGPEEPWQDPPIVFESLPLRGQGGNVLSSERRAADTTGL